MKTQTTIRIPCRSHDDAKELALRLEADGYRAARRWKTVIARTATSEESEQLFRKLQLASGATGKRTDLAHGAPLSSGSAAA